MILNLEVAMLIELKWAERNSLVDVFRGCTYTSGGSKELALPAAPPHGPKFL